MGVRFIHTADWQIGMPFDFLSEAAAAGLRKARFSAAERMIDAAHSNNVDFVVICGDLFDDSRTSNELISLTLKKIEDFERPVYVITGNHEVKGGPDILRSEFVTTHKPANLTILDSGPHYLEKFDVELIAAPVVATHQDSDPLLRVLNELEPSDRIRIVLGHGIVDQVAFSGNDKPNISLENLEKAIKEKRIDFVALGDRHSYLLVGDSGRIAYSGSPEPTDFNENDPGKCVLVEITDKASAPRVQPQAVGEWSLMRVGTPTERYRLRNRGNIDELAERIRKVRRKDKTCLKLYLDIHLRYHEYLYWLSLAAEFAEEFAAIVQRDGSERSVKPVIYEDPSDLSIPENLSGYLEDAYKELWHLATDGPDDEREEALQALILFGRLVERSQ